jgi:uncharacterized FlaG/YvyC family protein
MDTPMTVEPGKFSDDLRTLFLAVKEVNAAALFGKSNEVTFRMEEGSSLAKVRIVRRATQEVMNEIPAEYVLRMAEELKRTRC